MKRLIILGVLCGLMHPCFSQTQEAQQLLLNWEKLAQLKSILKNMYQGYQVVSKGYNKIRDISQGNYQLHEVFLDGLLEVSPAVRKYQKVADIISYQQKILQEGKEALNHFRNDGSFSAKECQYMRSVYQNLLKQSIQNLDELFLVLSAGTLRMSDEERLGAIDRIFADIESKLTFLRSFHNSNKILSGQRKNDKASIALSRKLNGLR